MTDRQKAIPSPHPPRPSFPRLTESKVALIPGILLSILWIAGMSVIDASAYTHTPSLWILSIVTAIAAIAILIGYKVVRMPLLGWLSLAAATYYLVRALTGFSVIENWSDAGLILGGIIFYIAGLYTGQNKSNRSLMIVLITAVLLNLFYLWLMKNHHPSLHFLGRADVSLSGPNSRNTSLFVYKNFAGGFLALSGSLLVWRTIWQGINHWRDFFTIIIGLAAIVASSFCGTRAIWFMLPLLTGIGWLLWLIIRLYSNRPIGRTILIGVGLIVIVSLVLIGDLFFSNNLLKLLTEFSSHGRYYIWDTICHVAPKAPLWGFGPGGAQWEIVPYFSEWRLPNYAHNEYLQMWADYGIIGLLLMSVLLILHFIQGFRTLANDHINQAQRSRAAIAIMILISLSGIAISDFIWHNFSLVAMTAFACGTLATPTPHPPITLFSRRKWAPGSGPSVRPIRAESNCGRVLIFVLALTLITTMMKLSSTLYPAWLAHIEYDTMSTNGATIPERRAFILSVLPNYPDSSITDHYIAMAPGGAQPDWAAYEQGLLTALQGNPRQFFTASILAQLLSKQNRHEEAEIIARGYYPELTPDNKRLSSWISLYAINLQKWGRQEMYNGNPAKALSLMTYGDNIAKKSGYINAAMYRRDARSWTRKGTPELHQFLKSCKTDLNILRAMELTPDDSWQQPLEPGGKKALYQHLQNKAK